MTTSSEPAPDVRRGDIYYINPSSRTVPNGTNEPTARPAIIVSNDNNNKFSDYIEVVFMTTRYKNPLPTHVEIKSADKPSTALCENINTVHIDRIGDYMTHLTDEEIDAVNAALAISIGISYSDDSLSTRGGAQSHHTTDDPTLAAEYKIKYNEIKRLYIEVIEKLTGKI